MKVSAPHRGWTSGRATPSLRPTPMRQRQQTRQDATYRSRKSVQTTAASSLHGAGLAIVMEDMVAPFIADGRLVRLLEDWSPPLSGYHLYYPNRRHPSPAFAGLLEELRANSHL